MNPDYFFYAAVAVVAAFALLLVILPIWDRIRPRWASLKLKLMWLGATGGLAAVTWYFAPKSATSYPRPAIITEALGSGFFWAGVGLGMGLAFALYVLVRIYWPSWDVLPQNHDEIGPD